MSRSGEKVQRSLQGIEAAPEVKAEPAKKRGRPKNPTTITTPPAPAPVGEKIRKKPGRPPKNPETKTESFNGWIPFLHFRRNFGSM